MSTQTLIDDRARLFNQVADILTSDFAAVEKQIIKDILAEIKKLNFEGGKIKSDKTAEAFLMSINNIIQSSLLKSRYPEIVSKYLTSFDKVQANIDALQTSVGNAKVDARKVAPVKRIMISEIQNKLIGDGVSANFTQPLREILYKQVMFNVSYDDAATIVRNYITSTKGQNGALLRYVTQVSRDGINQYTGAIEQKISDELGANAYMYVGSNLTCECGNTGCGSHCTRAQCKRWTKKKYLLIEDLMKEIEWAYNNGSGMIVGTNLNNFAINRGGWNCRHQALGVYLTEDRIAAIKNSK